MPTVAQVLRESALSASDAAELLSRALGLTRSDLRLARERVLTDDEAARFAAWESRRKAGEPVQYITGRAAFRWLDLAVDRRVLIPRPETEGLVECVLTTLREERARWPRPRVLDLGTGSGAIALAIAHEWPEAIVVATDLSAGALELAAENAHALGLAERVEWRAGDWWEAIAGDERFEVIVSNPPYIATSEWDDLPHDVRAFEPDQALFSGASGLEALREIVDEAPRHLAAHGLLALELSETRAAEVAAWLDGAQDWTTHEVKSDLAGQPRWLLARRERGPAIAPQQWPEERGGESAES